MKSDAENLQPTNAQIAESIALKWFEVDCPAQPGPLSQLTALAARIREALDAKPVAALPPAPDEIVGYACRSTPRLVAPRARKARKPASEVVPPAAAPASTTSTSEATPEAPEVPVDAPAPIPASGAEGWACSLDGCGRRAVRIGLCRQHYERKAAGATDWDAPIRHYNRKGGVASMGPTTPDNPLAAPAGSKTWRRGCLKIKRCEAYQRKRGWAGFSCSSCSGPAEKQL